MRSVKELGSTCSPQSNEYEHAKRTEHDLSELERTQEFFRQARSQMGAFREVDLSG